jgi:hypothetical protein
MNKLTPTEVRLEVDGLLGELAATELLNPKETNGYMLRVRIPKSAEAELRRYAEQDGVIFSEFAVSRHNWRNKHRQSLRTYRLAKLATMNRCILRRIRPGRYEFELTPAIVFLWCFGGRLCASERPGRMKPKW